MRTYLSIVGFSLAAYAFAMDGEERKDQVLEGINNIKRELSTVADHPWAGEYYDGDGLGMNLRLYIAPKNGVAYQWHGCLGLYEQNLGSIENDDSEIRVSWKWEDTSRLHDATVYIPIKWGDDAFLVAQQDILEFCIEARSVATYFSANSLRRTGGAKGKPSGKPELPKAYEKYRTLNHFKADIIQASAQIAETTADGVLVQQKVTINVGRDVGILPKMSFYTVKQTGKNVHSLTVTEVGESTSTAVETSFRLLEEVTDPLTIGIPVTTNWLSILKSK